MQPGPIIFARLFGLQTLLYILFCGSSDAVAAHPVSVSRTLVYVSRENATATIELFLEDVYLFHNLQPNDSNFLSRKELNRGIDLHRSFVAERFIVRDATGNVISPAALPKVTAAIPDDGVAPAELMNHKLVFDLQYQFAAVPEFLTFEQTFSGPDAVLPAEMQIQVKQQSGPELLKQSLVRGEPQTVRLNWSSTPPDEEASEEERTKWLAQQEEETLGISSYSSVYSFLYIEDYEIRLEVLIPLLTLEESVSLPRTDAAFLSVQEQDAARPAIENFLTEKIELLPTPVGGRIATEVTSTELPASLAPVMERCDFYGVSFKDFAQMAERRPVSTSSGRVGVILTWPLNDPAESFDLTWNLFSKSVWAVRLIVIEGDAVTRNSLAKTGGRNHFRWRRSAPVVDRQPLLVAEPSPEEQNMEIPVVSAVCLILITFAACLKATSRPIRARMAVCLLIGMAVGPAIPGTSIRIPMGYKTISDAQADSVCKLLLPQAYAAFRYRTENDIYDALAVSVSGDLLQDIYLDLLSGLTVQEQGGAVCRITSVEILEVESLPSITTEMPQLFCRCKWNVSGTVEHWGHIHQRENQFSGNLTIKYIDAAWKVTKLNIVEEQQLSIATDLRNLTETENRN